jgi:hypothetical protein
MLLFLGWDVTGSLGMLVEWELEGETAYSKKPLPLRQSAHLKSEMDSLGIELGRSAAISKRQTALADMALGFCHTSIYRASFQPISVCWPVHCISTRGNNQNIHTEMNHHTQIADLVRVEMHRP